MAFNTAILFDIENLLKGYAFSQQTITNLSLKEIVSAIKQTEKVGDIAIQRAYANWSDPRLSIMRGEMNELGIEPIQVFGFSQDQKKNAADIQLVVDAIDLAYVRPALEVFVIVSGDGGFAALAKKLHEYGRTVIGCSYRKATNRVFQAVCDRFVWIADPEQEEDERPTRLSSQANYHTVKQITDPRVIRLTNKVFSMSTKSDDDVIAKTKEVLGWFDKDPESHRELGQGGIHLSSIREALKYAIVNFHPMMLGFPKFVEYLQFACQNTPFCVVRSQSSEVLMVLRNAIPRQCEILPDLDRRELHCLETYKSILTGPGGPAYRLPSLSNIAEVANWISQKPLIKDELGNGIEMATNDLYPQVDAESARLAFLSFISADVYKREPDGVPLSEQKLTLREDLRSPHAILTNLRKAVQSKIENVLGQDINTDVLQQIVP